LLEGVVKRLQTYRDPELPHDVKFFSMKVLFLITALCEGITPQLKNELLVYLTDILHLILKEVGGMRGDQNGAASSDVKITLPVSTLWLVFYLSLRCKVKNNFKP
jgi:hypothetical protein